MALITINDARINTVVLHPPPAAGPGGPVVVCVHGLGHDSLASFYWTLGVPLARAGFTVALYDLRGHGGSSRPTSGYRLDDFTAELGGVIDYAATEHDARGPLHLIGNSYGGAIALHYAHRHPERIAGVAVIESGPPTALWSRSMRLAVDGILGTLTGPDALRTLADRLGPVAAEEALRAVADVAATTFAAEVPTGTLLDDAQVRSYPHPVLALFGGSSPAAVVAPMLAAMPRCRTEVLPGQTHTLLVDVPDRVREMVLPWLVERAADAAVARRGT